MVHVMDWFLLRLKNERIDDHRIFIDVDTRTGDITGMIEISKQPKGSISNAVPLPYLIKFYRGDLQPYLSNLLVAKRYRKRGLGRKLVAKSISIVRDEWQIDLLGLHYDTSNTYLRRFYSKLGFIPDPNGDTTTEDGINLTYAMKKFAPSSSFSSLPVPAANFPAKSAPLLLKTSPNIPILSSTTTTTFPSSLLSLFILFKQIPPPSST